MPLAPPIQRLFNALSFANVGESLTLTQKTRALSGTPESPRATAANTATAPASATSRSQVGLYLGSELPVNVAQYVLQTCARLQHGLTVFSFQSERDIDNLLAPHRAALAEANIAVRVVALSGDPSKVLGSTLKRRPDIAFLVCNESGFLGNRLTRGAMSPESLPVPVVLVAARGTAVEYGAAHGVPASDIHAA